MSELPRPGIRHFLIGTVVLALAGCGTATMTNARGPSAPQASAVSAAMSPQQRAKADAVSILAAFIPPPGARRMAGLPGGVGGELNNPGFLTLGDPDFVDNTSVWKIQGRSPLQVLDWEKAHLPRRFVLTITSGAASGPPPRLPGLPSSPRYSDPYQYASYGFDLPELPGILIGRQLVVQTARPRAGQTYVRVDAEVTWLPRRSASERVPAGVSVITITAQPSMSRPHHVPAPVTVTDPAKVGKIVALIDGLYLEPAGVRTCALEAGTGITLSFLGHVNGPVLATVIPSCYGIEFTIRGRQEPALGDPGPFDQEVLSIAGLPLSSYGLPTPVQTP